MLSKVVNGLRRLVRDRRSMIDRGLERAARVVSDRTGGRYDGRGRAVRQKADAVLDDAEPPAGGRTSYRSDETDAPQRPGPRIVAGPIARRAIRRTRSRK